MGAVSKLVFSGTHPNHRRQVDPPAEEVEALAWRLSGAAPDAISR